MKFIARIVGLVFVLVGFAGLVAAVAAIVGAWTVRGKVQEQAPQVIASAHESLQSIDDQLNQAQQAVQRASTGVETFRAAAQTAASKLGEGGMVDPQSLSVLDEQVSPRFENARELLQTVEATTVFVTKLGSFAESIPGVSVDELSPDGPLRTNISHAVSELRKIGELLETARQRVAEIREDPQITRERVEQVIEIANGIQERLTAVESSIVAFDETVATADDKLALVEREWPSWLQIAVVTATCLLVWLALSQLGLLLWGNRLLRD